jgi:hypothetical protein
MGTEKTTLLEICMRCKLVSYESENGKFWTQQVNIPNFRYYYRRGLVAEMYCPPCKNKMLVTKMPSILEGRAQSARNPPYGFFEQERE